MDNRVFAKFEIEELTWGQVKLEVKKANPVLFEAIEALDPNKKLTLIKAHYPYGALIVDNGVLHLPHQSGACISINETSVTEKIKKNSITLLFHWHCHSIKRMRFL